jgi:hypothetical protein
VVNPTASAAAGNSAIPLPWQARRRLRRFLCHGRLDRVSRCRQFYWILCRAEARHRWLFCRVGLKSPTNKMHINYDTQLKSHTQKMNSTYDKYIITNWSIKIYILLECTWTHQMKINCNSICNLHSSSLRTDIPTTCLHFTDSGKFSILQNKNNFWTEYVNFNLLRMIWAFNVAFRVSGLFAGSALGWFLSLVICLWSAIFRHLGILIFFVFLRGTSSGYW